MTPLVMIPGMMCDERIFAPQIEELASKRSVHIADISKHDNISDLAAELLTNGWYCCYGDMCTRPKSY